jgi:hypothetical protein
MTLTIKNFHKLEEPLNTVYFDFGMWTATETYSSDEAYVLAFYNKPNPSEFPVIEVSLNRNKVDGHGYHLETKLWQASNNWVSLDEMFVGTKHIENRYILLKCVEEIIRGVEL